MVEIEIAKLKEFIESNYSTLVQSVEIRHLNELRVYFHEGSFLEIWYSVKLENRYSYHWERRNVSGKIYRHDNSPHIKWKHVISYPKHFHFETEENVIESTISDLPRQAIKQMMEFIASQL